jgi:surface polysaccharide O-acyltransferase-like enzyme
MTIVTEKKMTSVFKAVMDRNYSIDTFRLISIFFVILHHVSAFKRSYLMYYPNPVLKVLYYLSANVRFLPFFFIAAGYFFRKGFQKGERVKNRLWKYCSRLAKLFFLWSLVYAFSPASAKDRLYGILLMFHSNVLNMFKHPFAFLMTGTSEMFWFFPALIIGLTVVTLMQEKGMGKYVIPLGVVLYVIALLGKTYSVLPWGYRVEFEMRQGPFVSTLFVGIGWMLAGKNNFRLKTALLLIGISIVMQFAETLFLYYGYGVKPLHEYLLATIFFNTGIFMFCLARPNIGRNTILPQWGRLTLGVYCIHSLIGRQFYIIRPYFNPIFYDFMEPALIYLLSILATMILLRVPFTKGLVT